jgi:hypothetical protein
VAVLPGASFVSRPAHQYLSEPADLDALVHSLDVSIEIMESPSFGKSASAQCGRKPGRAPGELSGCGRPARLITTRRARAKWASAACA